jgi:hypothetical protein
MQGAGDLGAQASHRTTPAVEAATPLTPALPMYSGRSNRGLVDDA